MSDPFVGEIRIFAGNFAPRGWALCNGQLLSPSDNGQLFSLLGTMYGGDGRTSFAVPDLRGRAPMHHGSGPGLTPRRIGAKAGSVEVTLNVSQIPSHSHGLMASDSTALENVAQGRVLGHAFADTYDTAGTTPTAMAQESSGLTGGTQAHNNEMPYLTLNFIISLTGLFPSAN